jgi:hypothetical protein
VLLQTFHMMFCEAEAQVRYLVDDSQVGQVAIPRSEVHDARDRIEIHGDAVKELLMQGNRINRHIADIASSTGFMTAPKKSNKA